MSSAKLRTILQSREKSGAGLAPARPAPVNAPSAATTSAHPLLQMQRSAGNRAVVQLLHSSQTIQKQSPDEDEAIQGKFAVQRQEELDDEAMQGKFDPQSPAAAQRQADESDDEAMQGKFTIQRESHAAPSAPSSATGIPRQLQSHMENVFQADFSNVRVHANSSQAPKVGALAYTQGTDIHFAPGQFSPDTSSGRRLLGHELTHVMQQEAGKVQATGQVEGLPVNDNPSFEHEADSMGEKARNLR